MNTKSITLAAILGILLGILVLRPLWMVTHAFDGGHENASSLDNITSIYADIFSFKDIGPILLAIFFGFIIIIFIMMLKERRKNRNM